MIGCTVKNIHRIYGRVACNQLPGHARLFLRELVKIISHGRIGKSKKISIEFTVG